MPDNVDQRHALRVFIENLADDPARQEQAFRLLTARREDVGEWLQTIAFLRSLPRDPIEREDKLRNMVCRSTTPPDPRPVPDQPAAASSRTVPARRPRAGRGAADRPRASGATCSRNSCRKARRDRRLEAFVRHLTGDDAEPGGPRGRTWNTPNTGPPRRTTRTSSTSGTRSIRRSTTSPAGRGSTSCTASTWR